MALGGFPLGGDALGGAGSVLYTLDTTAGAFTLTGYPVKPYVLGTTAATYSLASHNPSLYKRVTISSGYKDTFDTGLVKTTLPITAGAFALNSNPVSAVYTQFVPQPVFPFWIFVSGSWQTVLFAYLIWLQWSWVNGVQVRSIVYNVGPGALTISGNSAWLDHVSSTQRFTQVSAEVFYVPFPSHRITSLAAEVFYTPSPAQRLTSLAVEVFYSNIKAGIQTLPTSYVISASTVAFSRTHNALSASAGAFALTSYGVTLTHTYPALSGTTAAFTLASNPITFVRNRTLNAAAGAVALSLKTATLTPVHKIVAAAGSFALAGQNATLLNHRLLSPASKALLLSGSAMTATFTRKLFPAATALTLAGQNATLLYHHLLSAAASAVAIAGQGANLHQPLRILYPQRGTAVQFITALGTADLYPIRVPLRTIDIGPGVFTRTGRTATLKYNRVLTAAPGALSIAGSGVQLTKVIYKGLFATGGSFAISGQATLLVNRVLTTAPGALALSGINAGSLRNRVLTASFGQFLLAGQGATLNATGHLNGVTAAIVLSGKPVALKVNKVLTAAAGALSLAANDATLAQKRRLQAQAGGFTIALFDLQIGSVKVLNGLTGSYALSAAGASLLKTKIWSIGTGSFTISGNAADSVRKRIMSPLPGNYAIAPKPINLFFWARVMQLGTGALTIAGVDIQEWRAFPIGLLLDPGAITVSGNAATLATGRVLNAAAGAVAISAPTILYPKRTLLAQAANFNVHGGAPQQQLRSRAGSIAITSSGATLNRTQTLLAAADAFTIAGNDLGGGLVRLLSAQKGSFVLAGKPVALSHPRILYTAAGALLLNANDTTHALTRKIVARPAAFSLVARPLGFTTVKAISARAAAFLIDGVTIWPDKEAKAVFTVTKVMNVEMDITHRTYVEGSVTARMGVIGGVSEPQASFTVRPANP